MKKYMIYVFAFVLLLPLACGAAVMSQRNHFYIGIREIKDKEYSKAKDPKALASLSYQFEIQDRENTWKVDGKGVQMKQSYEKRDLYPQWAQNQVIESVFLSPIFDADTMQNNEDEYPDTEDDDLAGAYPDDVIGHVDSITYRLQHHTVGTREIKTSDILSFTITAVRKDGIYIQYDRKQPQNTLTCRVSREDGDTVFDHDDPYGNARSLVASNAQVLQDEGFFYIGPLDFHMDFSLVSFDHDPGGIYQFKDGKVKQIVSLPLGKKDILKMVSTKDRLVALVLEQDELYLHMYDTKGKRLSVYPLHMGLQQYSDFVLRTDRQQHVFFGYHAFYAEGQHIHVFDCEKQSFQPIDEVDIPVDMLDEASDQSFMEYDDGVLYVVTNSYNTYNTILLGAFAHDGTLYKGEIYGDYQDDQAISASYYASYNPSAYERLVSGFVNYVQRDVQLRAVEIER